MADTRTLAQDLMTREFETVMVHQLLKDALNQLLTPHSQKQGQTTLVVTNPDGSYAGLFSSHALLKALLAFWKPGRHALKDKQKLAIELNAVIKDQLDMKVSRVMMRGMPEAGPEGSLGHLLKLMGEDPVECIPVIENGKAIGLIYIKSLFGKISQIALTTKHQGINLP